MFIFLVFIRGKRSNSIVFSVIVFVHSDLFVYLCLFSIISIQGQKTTAMKFITMIDSSELFPLFILPIKDHPCIFYGYYFTSSQAIIKSTVLMNIIVARCLFFLL